MEPRPDVPVDAYVTTVTNAPAAHATSFREVSRTELEGGNAYLVETEMVIGASAPVRQKWFITLNGDFVVVIVGSISTGLFEVHGPLVDEMFAIFETFPPASVVDDHGDFPAQATTIAIGSSTQGVISDPLDVDLFRFDAQVGVTYRAQVQLGSLSDSLITLLGATGSCSLASNDDIVGSLASRLTWTARESATLFVVVENADGTSTGSYTLSLQTADPSGADDHGGEACSATPMEGATTIDGLVSELGDVDAFSFEAVGGTAYVLEVVLESLEDSFLTLFDIDGLTLLADNDDFFAGSLASRISWTAPQSGTYYLAVAGVGGTGSYRLRVSPETSSSGTGGGAYRKPGAEQRPAPAVVR